jgi:hypothetical protein
MASLGTVEGAPAVSAAPPRPLAPLKAIAPWTREEEQEVGRRFRTGEEVKAIAKAHKRSPCAIELRLQRLGLFPKDT